jgi:hypothetical protein
MPVGMKSLKCFQSLHWMVKCIIFTSCNTFTCLFIYVFLKVNVFVFYIQFQT